MSCFFPDNHLIPKQESGALHFLECHPSYDGRGIRIGILDTGVDPGAKALFGWNNESNNDSKNKNYKSKLINVVDCTGSGDVELSFETIATLENDAYYVVTALSGRTLRLGKDWTFAPFPKDKDNNNTTTTTTATTSVPIRIGIKRAYELYPTKLLSRIKEERQAVWNAEVIAPLVATVRKQMAQLPNNNNHDNNNKIMRDEYQARLQILQDKQWNEEDPGPLLDCVVFYDGTDYRAVVVAVDDTNNEDLTNYKPLTSFDKEHQYATVGVMDQFNFAVHFYQQGKILSIVSDASPHGTHVAAIAAAEKSTTSPGVAPGAQLVALKIGDSRLGSMETGTSLCRAMMEAIRHKCHVINLSYGEGCQLPNTGRVIELAQELVYKHGILFVSSAGNNGPALSTVGAPGGTTSAILGIAAHVSPKMQQVLYSFPVNTKQNNETANDAETTNNDNYMPPPNIFSGNKEEHLGSTYTWSSVGPTTDGDWGVNLTAPGGAITAVSNWTLQKSQLMNGTSMASPHATGCCALLYSACLQKQIDVSPALMKRALMNTATTLDKLLICQQGAGMINVPAAWEYLQTHVQTGCYANVDFSVSVENLPGSSRGIYLRQAHETNVAHTCSILIEPIWPRQDKVTPEMQKAKIDFELQVNLVSTAPKWVTPPEHFMLMNNGRAFKVEVDPTALPPGLHIAQVLGMDAKNPQVGPLFRVPITVIKTPNVPLDTRQVDFGDLSFEPAETKRFFVVPPLGSTWMDVILTDTRNPSDEGASKLYALHTVQLLPHAAYRDFEQAKCFNMRPGQTTATSIAVEPGVTAEIVIGRYWSTLGNTSLNVQVNFRGVRPVPNQVSMVCGDGGSLVRVVSDFVDESIQPAAKLNKWWTPLRPMSNPIISPLCPRDVFPSHDTQIYQLVLVFELTQDEKGSFTPRVPTLQGVLYESGYESQLIMVYDGEKKLLGTVDAWPSSISAPKGKIVLRMQIRHDDPDKLEALKETPLWIERSIDKEISLSVYSSREAMMLGKSTFRKQTLPKGSQAAVFFQEPSVSKIPSGCKAGDVLKGSFTLCSGESTLLGEGKRPKGFPITYTVGPKPAKVSDPDPPEPKDDRTVQEKLDDDIRDLKVARLDELNSKEKEDGKFELLCDQFVKEYPKHLPLLMAKLRYLDAHPKRKDKLADVVNSADAVLSEIDEDALALYFGRKSDPDDPEANKLKKEMKERKSFFVEALARSAMAQADFDTDASKIKFDEIVTKMKAWVDVESDKQYISIYLERERRAGRYGTVVKAINKILSKEVKEKDFLYPLDKSKLMAERATALEKLGYTALVDRDQAMRVVACPRSYALF